LGDPSSGAARHLLPPGEKAGISVATAALYPNVTLGFGAGSTGLLADQVNLFLALGGGWER